MTAKDQCNDAEIRSQLQDLPGWAYDASNVRIEKTFVRKDFRDAVGFIRQIAYRAEAHDHHPDILLSNYKNVKVMLSTHSAGGVTANDFDLARAIENLLA